ncbi:hypothetical protein HYS31_04005 [Candidatus Woesearchaeota archaeon]|nr:hypothetical protein [Candidatus Woesearchaeota archaeon]
MGEECCGDGCCESGKGSGCCEESCCCEESMSKGKYMMGLADRAWEELMKEKMKVAFEKAKGEKMERVAQMSVEACMAYWSNKMKEEGAWAEFEEKLRNAMK